jgi:hypothetical protein
MKNLFIMAALILAPIVGFAHGDHTHKKAIEKTQATDIAKTQVTRLISDGKLDATWKDAELVGTEKKKNKSTWEWLSTFRNSKEVDATKQTLYIFLTLSGEFVAANHSGK